MLGLNSLMVYLLQNQSWIIFLFIVPISLIYDLFIHLQNGFYSLTESAKSNHEDKIKEVQRQISQRKKQKDKRKMCTARPGWKSISLQKIDYKEKCYQIKIDMANILSLDEKNQRVLVEPMVTIGVLNDYLIKLGWTLPVVPELDDLTIGGLVMGGGIESTSHKYGLFQYICTMYEVILSDGSLVVCSSDKNEDLYCALPFSYGTLGFLTSIELIIIPYKPYIKLTYCPIYSLDSLVEKFTSVTNDACVDSVEGILMNSSSGVIMHGEFVSQVESQKIYHLGAWHTEWFYTHVERILKEGKNVVEYIPTKDFFHRHNKSWFWLMRYIIPNANSFCARWLFGWAMPPKFAFLKFLRQRFVPSDLTKNFVCQDFGFDLHLLKEALLFVDKETEIYPIWLCPTRHIIPSHLERLSLFRTENVHVDIGIYGFCEKKTGFHPIQTQRNLERYAIDHKGYVALYAETQLSREEFDEMFGFNLRNYNQLRRKLNCENDFPHVYEKISKLGRS